jgi:ectoine hydroxylase-related dioxygenase (phytanoyl-CoA dioxygenase family)
MNYYEYEKYVSSHEKESIKSVLDQYGIVIIPNILNEKECKEMLNGTWNFFEYVTNQWETPIDRNKINTWKYLLDLKPNMDMMYQKWNIGHSQHLWDIRTNMKVVNIFADFWNVKPENLLVSFDGMSFLPPPEYTNFGWSDSKTWFHLDQTITKPYFDGIQSWITGYDVDDGDSTLIFYEGSHKLINNFVKQFGIRTKSDWFLLKKEEENFFKLNCEMKAIKCPAGSLVIWDSRLVHCAMGPIKNRKNRNFRCISYLSYAPKSLCDNETINKKIEGFTNLYTSNHYANRSTFFSTIPNEYELYELEDLITQIDPPVLNSLGKSLVGII